MEKGSQPQPQFHEGPADHVNNNTSYYSSNKSVSSKSGGGTGDHRNTRNVGGCTEDALIESGEPHDSGHFTVSPDVEHNVASGGSGCSDSSRGASPINPISFQQDHSSSTSSFSDKPTTSAALVLQACRERKLSQPRKIDITSSSPTYAYSRHDNATYSESTKYTSSSMDSVGSKTLCSGGTTSTSAEESDEVSSESSPSVSYLKTALDNFNALYQEKLQMIEDVGAQGDTAMKQSLVEKKAQILECWAKDVCVQNIVLIHTVEELEKQGEEKMRTLQQKISESSNLVKRHKEVVDSYEERIQILLKERASSHETHMSLKQDLDTVKTEYKRIRGRVNQLEKDNESLVTLITRIRDMGVWDVEGLEFHRRTFAQMFELYPHLPGSEVQTVFTREKARHIRETEDTVEKLESKVSDLEAFQTRACQVIEKKDSTISEMKTEMSRIAHKLQGCQEECDHYKKSLIETHEKLLQTTNELQIRATVPSRPDTAIEADTERHLEIQELLLELRNVKERLNISVQESQSAKTETDMIRKEFSDRLRAMQESQQCLQSELTHSFDTHHLVQEKQMELEKVKEKVQTYQSKCETTEAQLNNKDKIIEELQNTIKQLNDKKDMYDDDSHDVNSRDTFTSKNITPSSYLKCGRDRPSTRITLLPPRHQNQQRNGGKPAWSDNFVKASALDNCSTVTIASSSKSRSTLVGARGQTAGNYCSRPSCDHGKLDGISSNHAMCKSKSLTKLDKARKMTDLKQNTNCPESKVSMCGCAVLDRGENWTGLLDSPCHTNCSNTANYSFEINSTRKNERKQSAVTKNVDGKNVNEEKVMKTDLGETAKNNQKNQDDCARPKMDNPPTRSATYDILMGVAVKASKHILDSEMPENISSVTVTAGHRSYHKNKGNSKIQRSHFTTNASKNTPPVEVAANLRPSEGVPLIADTNHSFPSVSTKAHASRSLEELLSQLPEQSYAKVVREWIKSSVSSDATKNAKNKKAVNIRENPILRQIISQPVMADKALSILTSEKNTLISSSKMFAEKSRQIEKDIMGIQEEWSRVFCDVDGTNNDHFESPIPPFSAPETTTSKQSHSEESSKEAVVVTSTGFSDKQTLLQQFEMEKAKLAEDFLKQLKDKNIEIRMQKNRLGNGGETVSFLELVNVFENLKLDATKKVEDLRSVNNNLASDLHGMNDKLLNFNQLVKKLSISNENSFRPLSATATASSSYEKRILGHLARKIQECHVEVNDNSTKLETLQSILRRMESFGPETKHEICKMELELQLIKNINSQLQSKQEMSHKEILRLTEGINVLRQEKENAEMEVLATKLEVKRLEEANSAMDSSTASMTRNMEIMKQAFMENEEIIQAKNEEIARKDVLIKQYKKYCKKANEYLEAQSFATGQELWESEKAKILSENKELRKTIAKLEDKLITSETENSKTRNTLEWYMNQVERVENLHTTWLHNLPGVATADFQRLLQNTKDHERLQRTPGTGTGSGDADKEHQIE